MKKILHLFILSFVAMSGVLYLIGGEVGSSLLSGLVFALLLALVLGGLNQFNGGHDTVQEELMDLPLSFEEAFEQCREAGLQLKKAEIQEERRRDGILLVHTGASWKSWGDEVLFQVQDIDATTTRVAVTSRPRMKGTMMDYGQNYENVSSIRKHLQKAG
ncbi:hypothetical protein [Salimicrobium halophilum]|uniref:DUF1499 domain-containing protein n=1 Tax=Salimicrobium halophilum TaxID=86666 RepID=A0A1G8R9Y0_9BACI|nr:hypothetical protein [Salimicrobium halophilum]SDJ13673.1 hypothetical protein SAMN04490247_0909 [Salimicrobium halophilum]